MLSFVKTFWENIVNGATHSREDFTGVPTTTTQWGQHAAQPQKFTCPGKNPDTCKVLPGMGCSIDNVVYRATVTRADTSHQETYTGCTAQTIKGRFNGHSGDMSNPKLKGKGATLSRYIWELKDHQIAYSIKWDILRRAAPWNPITKFCRLCVEEKHQILFHPENATLNQRSEFFSKCFHKAKHLLAKS